MITQVQIKNYRSLAQVVVNLEPLTILVGPNGAGKSNFVDALRFISDALSTTLELALKQRGGINMVRRRSKGHPTHFGLRVKMDWGGGNGAVYAFQVSALPRGGFAVKREWGEIWGARAMSHHRFSVEEGALQTTVTGLRPKIEQDRLALTVLSAAEELRPLYDALTHMRFYSLVPDKIRELQEPDPGLALKRDGSNAAAVLRELEKKSPADYQRLCRLLGKVVPGTISASYLALGPKETLRFRQDVGDANPWSFEALNMSDGTLRVLGVLLAVYQTPTPPFIAIEEPESTVHPAAAEVLVDIFSEACSRSQIVITTHSPDILDSKNLRDDQIRAVEYSKGATIISPLGAISREAIRRRLYSPGDLLRSGELEPDRLASEQLAKQLKLFEREAVNAAGHRPHRRRSE